VEIGVPTELSHGEDMNNCLDHFMKNMWESQQYKESSLTPSEEKQDDKVEVKSDKKSDFVPKDDETKAESGPAGKDDVPDPEATVEAKENADNNPDQKASEQDQSTNPENNVDPPKTEGENAGTAPESEKVDTAPKDENVDTAPQADSTNNLNADPNAEKDKDDAPDVQA